MAKWPFSKNPKQYLDRVEQVLVMPFYISFFLRLWPDEISTVNWYVLLLLLSEGFVIVLVLVRRRTELISVRFRDWAIAFAGSFLVLLVGKGGEPLWIAGGVILLLVGMAIHMGAKLSLLRSFGLVAADRGLKQQGLYKIVRHPMYAGYILTHIGYLLVAPSWRNLGLYVATWLLLTARIFAEERLLSSDPRYKAYMARVQYRMLPSVF